MAQKVMEQYKELKKGDLILPGDERMMSDGTWRPCEWWDDRRVEGGFFRRRAPHVIWIDDPWQPETKTHVYYRLAEERDIGKTVWFSDRPRTQEYLLHNAPEGTAKLVGIDGEFQGDCHWGQDGSRYAYVREEIPLVTVVAPKKREFRLADEDHLGSNCYFTDEIVDPEEVREGWENDVVQGEYCERLVEINHNKKGMYVDSGGNTWRFAWVPVE